MQKGDVLRVRATCTSQFFDAGGIYEAQIVQAFNNGNHYMQIADKFNEIHFANMFNTCCLNGGNFEIYLERVK